MTLSAKQIALVHVACKKLGINNDDRHAIQETVGGARSLTRMSESGWRELVRHFEARGFKSPLREGDSSQLIADSKTKLIRKLYAEWRDLKGYWDPGKERPALRGFLRKRFHVEHERFLTPELAIKAIEAVKAIGRRQGSRGE